MRTTPAARRVLLVNYLAEAARDHSVSVVHLDALYDASGMNDGQDNDCWTVRNEIDAIATTEEAGSR